jgi:hypothetical protein
MPTSIATLEVFMTTFAFRRLRRAALACFALTAFLLTAFGSASPQLPHFRGSEDIWFQPLPAGITVGGSTDFPSLFKEDAPWPRVRAKTRVMGFYAGWLIEVSPQTLHSIVAFLNDHNMAIEIEAPALQAMATCGSGVEGYVPYGLSLKDFTLDYLERLKQFGAGKIFIKVDEPYYFGTVVNDPRSCHFTEAHVAVEVHRYVQIVKSVFPDAEVGDVEPVIDCAYPGGAVAALEHWHEAYWRITGEPFPFYIADIDFSNPEWPALVKQLEDGTRLLGMRFGIIYIGDQQDASDAEWAGKVVARFEEYQGANGGHPDFVFFQSWEPHPRRCLPETYPDTFTGVIDAYIDATS